MESVNKSDAEREGRMPSSEYECAAKLGPLLDKNDILRAFVLRADHGNYPYLHQPWSKGDYIYASDGSILVRLRADGMQAPALPPDSGPHQVDQMLDAPQACFVRVPDVPTFPCSTCRGTGTRSFSICLACRGKGEFLRGSHWYDCKECDGSGDVLDRGGALVIECADCLGDGVVDLLLGSDRSLAVVPALNTRYLVGSDRSLAVGPAFFATRYLALLNRLPGAEIAVVDAVAAAVFRFQGGDGLLAPMRGPASR